MGVRTIEQETMRTSLLGACRTSAKTRVERSWGYQTGRSPLQPVARCHLLVRLGRHQPQVATAMELPLQARVHRSARQQLASKHYYCSVGI